MILSAQNLHLGNANVNLVFEHGIISPAYKVYELNKCDQYFVQSWVKKDSTKDFFLNATTEGASQCRKNIDWYILNNQLIVIPSLYEQIRIGKLFDCLNHLITLHQSKSFGHILEEIVSCALSWEQRKLGEVAIFNPKSKLPSTFEYVDLESVIGTEMVSHSTKTISTAPSRAQRLAKKGDIFYQTVRPYQKNNYLFEKDRRNYVFSTGYAQLRPSVNERFLFYLIQNGNFVNMVLYNCTGTSYPAINSSDLRRIDIYLSRNSTEQKCIGNTIKTLDHLITLHQLEPFQLIFKAIAYRIIDYAKSKPPRHTKYEIIISFIKYYL